MCQLTRPDKSNFDRILLHGGQFSQSTPILAVGDVHNGTWFFSSILSDQKKGRSRNKVQSVVHVKRRQEALIFPDVTKGR